MLIKFYSKPIQSSINTFHRFTIRYLSSSSINLNESSSSQSNNEAGEAKTSSDNKYDKYQPNSRFSKLSPKIKELMFSKELVEGEPVPPAKNRYINLKNPALNAFRPEEFDESKASFFMFPGQGMCVLNINSIISMF
jgi:hypothetical protein